MEGQELITTIQKLIDSGALENIEQPGGQTLVVYSLLILLGGMVFKYIVLNGTVKRFFDLEERKVAVLEDIQAKVIGMQQDVQKERDKLHDILSMLKSGRRTDKV
jgi:hypothetical protein